MSNDIRVEKMSQDDSEIYAREIEEFDDAEWAFEVFNEFVNDPYGYFFKAYYCGEIAGFCSMYHNTMNAKHFCKIMDLRVKKDFRRKGVARALMLEVLAWAKRLGLDVTKLEVDTKSGAVKLYESLGFQIEKTEEKFYDDGADAYIMWRYEHN